MEKELNLLTLFSGIGSPEMGASRVYEKVNHIAACEWDKFARESFNANYEIDPKHFHKDIADMDGKQYQGQVDIIFGGSPCQDFSLAGLRKGIDGNKGILIYEYIRIIQEVQPPIFIYENVKGMVSDKKGRTLKEFVQAFRDMGYHCHYEVLNTKDYGVPQNRERIFLVGFKDSEHYHNFSFAPKIKLQKRLKDVLEYEVDEKDYLSDKMIKGFIKTPGPTKIGYINQDTQASQVISSDGVSNTLCAGTHGYAQGYIEEPNCTPIGLLDIKNRRLRETITKHIEHLKDGTFIDSYNKSIFHEYSPCLSTRTDASCNSHIWIKSATKKGYETALPGDSINLTHPGSTTRRGRVGKQVAQTLDCACNQSTLLEDYRIRKLTPRECFRLQDFPNTFKQVVSNSQAYKQAGNSILVNMSEMIFRQIELSRYGNTNKDSLF